jgi:glycosyltransferase involved in cell wall biosynthesis
MASLLGPLLCKGRFDRVVVFQPGPFSVALPGILMKWISRSPLFIWVQDIWPDALEEIEIIEDPLVFKAIAFVARQVYRRCDVLMVASEGYRERLQMLGIAPGKIKYLPQWAEEFYQVQDPDHAFGEREGMAGLFNVVFAGNIGLWQDMEVILDAADLLRGVPDILFVILGDGVKLKESIHYGKKKELPNVIFKGPKAGELMPKYFALAGALLLQLKASKAYSSMTIPAKLQTYFACGRPVIAAIKGAGAKVVEKAGGGIVCEPDDAKSLAEAVMQIYRSSIDDREAMGRKAREYYDHHFRRELVLEHLDVMLKAS